MDVHAPSALLGGLTPAAFMRRHWQKRPLVVRGALPGVAPPLPRARLFALAANDAVESRLVERDGDGWRVRHGPLPRRALPPASRPGWTLLVQGLDLHDRAAHALRARFRFAPDARLDDLMVSWASDGGGVGPHVDAYDVFLLQLQGRRRWRVGRLDRPGDDACIDGLPLKILRRFAPAHEWLLGPGDMLYLPPGWGHDGVADGECMTASIGYRAPTSGELGAELLQRIADEVDDDTTPPAGDGVHAARAHLQRYRDPAQPATTTPAAIPPALQAHAQTTVARLLREPGAVERALGRALSEPKPRVWFEAGAPWRDGAGLALAAKTRMLYDARHVYVNGEAYRAGGADARLLRRLADAGSLAPRDCARFGAAAKALVAGWVEAGWLEGTDR